MPYAPAKSCAMPCCSGYRQPGSKYCARHAPQFNQVEQDRRGTASERGYGARWARYRLQFLREYPVCACGCGQASTDVDHIKPVNGPDDPLFWDPGNHQALAHECHSRKTVTENGGFGRTKK